MPGPVARPIRAASAASFAYGPSRRPSSRHLGGALGFRFRLSSSHPALPQPRPLRTAIGMNRSGPSWATRTAGKVLPDIWKVCVCLEVREAEARVISVMGLTSDVLKSCSFSGSVFFWSSSSAHCVGGLLLLLNRTSCYRCGFFVSSDALSVSFGPELGLGPTTGIQYLRLAEHFCWRISSSDVFAAGDVQNQHDPLLAWLRGTLQPSRTSEPASALDLNPNHSNSDPHSHNPPGWSLLAGDLPGGDHRVAVCLLRRSAAAAPASIGNYGQVSFVPMWVFDGPGRALRSASVEGCHGQE